MITAGLVQRDPHRFDRALPMCGVLAGGVGVWNAGLDTEPAADQFDVRESNQFQWDSQVDFPFLFALRAELEGRAGGNPSWNTDVDYRHQLDISIDRDEVKALYAEAGLNLQDDLNTLKHAARVAADQSAVRYLTRNIVFNGDIDHLPVLTLHTTGDGLVLNQDEQAYNSIVDEQSLLRQRFVHRAGHCTFTPAETVAAFNALVERIHTGHWSGLAPDKLNDAANRLDSILSIAPAAYVRFHPTRFPRPFSTSDAR